MPVVTNTIKYPNGNVAAGRVTVDLVGADGRPVQGFVTASDYAIEGPYSADLVAGVWSVTLVPNSLINPSGTVYRVQESVDGRVSTTYISVPNGAGPYVIEDINADPPTAINDGASTAINAHLVDTTAAHSAAAVAFTPTTDITATDVQAAIEAAATTGSGTVCLMGRRYKTGGYYTSDLFGSDTTATLTLNQMVVMPFSVPQTISIDRMGVRVTTGIASGAVRLGVYEDDGSGVPGALLYDYGQVDATTTGAKETAVHEVELAAGQYWLAYAAQGAAPGVQITQAQEGRNPWLYQTAISNENSVTYLASGTISGALPASFVLQSTLQGNTCKAYVRVSLGNV